MMKNNLKPIVLFMVLSTLIVACSNGNKQNQETDNSTNEPAKESSKDLQKALLEAIKQENLQLVTNLLEQGTDGNFSPNPWTRPPLFAAAEVGNLDIVKTLIEYGADPKAGHDDELYNTSYAVDRAIREGHLEVVKYLYSIGAKSREPMSYVNEEDEAMYAFVLAQGTKSDSIAYAYRMLAKAYYHGDVDLGKKSIAQGATISPELISTVTSVEQVNFLKAINYDFAQLNDNHKQVIDFEETIHIFQNMNEEVFMLFLQAGVRPSPTSLVLLFSGPQKSLFTQAIAYLTKNYPDFNINDSFTYNILSYVIPFRGYEKVNNTTLLNMAVAAANTEAIKALLAHGADPTVKDKNGKVALDYASEQNKEAISELFNISEL